MEDRRGLRRRLGGNRSSWGRRREHLRKEQGAAASWTTQRGQYRISYPCTIVKRTLLGLMSLQSHLSAEIGCVLLDRERLLLAGIEQCLESITVESSASLLGAFFRRGFGGAQGRDIAPSKAGVRGWRGQVGWTEGILRLGQVEGGGIGKRRIGFHWDWLGRGERDRNLRNGRRKDIHGRRNE